MEERTEITCGLLLAKFDIFLAAPLLTLPTSISILHLTEIVLYARAVSPQKKSTSKSLDICPWKRNML